MSQFFDGLEGDYFCVHTPTLIRALEDEQYPLKYVDVSIKNPDTLELLMAFTYSSPDEDNAVLFDLSPWIKMLMPRFLNNTVYDTAINDQTQKTKDSEYIKE